MVESSGRTTSSAVHCPPRASRAWKLSLGVVPACVGPLEGGVEGFRLLARAIPPASSLAAPLGSRRRLNGNPVVVSCVYLEPRDHARPAPACASTARLRGSARGNLVECLGLSNLFWFHREFIALRHDVALASLQETHGEVSMLVEKDIERLRSRRMLSVGRRHWSQRRLTKRKRTVEIEHSEVDA